MMSVKKELESAGLYLFEHVDEKFNELKDQFIEMSQLKSNFDIEKFTVKKEGNFIAHNFHFLMRQYSLALSELRRMLIEKKETERKILEYKDKKEEKVLIHTKEGLEEKYADLYVMELINRLDMTELGIVNKAMMIKGFEACRQKLIEINGDKVPSNNDYQEEEPAYLKWQLENIALRQIKERNSGISELTWTQIDSLEEKEVINPNFRVKMLKDDGTLDLVETLKDIELRKHLGYKYDEVITKKLESQSPRT